MGQPQPCPAEELWQQHVVNTMQDSDAWMQALTRKVAPSDDRTHRTSIAADVGVGGDHAPFLACEIKLL
eukprot:4787786-Amphidinium_carterae.1